MKSLSSQNTSYNYVLWLKFFSFSLFHSGISLSLGFINDSKEIAINPWIVGNAQMHTQHCSCWCPGAKAPSHQCPQCWIKVHCIGQIKCWNGWRHDGCDSISNHQPHNCHVFRRRSKKTSKLRITGLCAGNSPVTGEFPAQRASNAENISIWWCHHEWTYIDILKRPVVGEPCVISS